jgi:hypothetical protein
VDLIKNLLERYSKLAPRHYKVKLATEEALDKLLGIKINRDDITVRQDVIYLKLSPKARLAIQTKKAAVLEEINSGLEVHYRDIR